MSNVSNPVGRPVVHLAILADDLTGAADTGASFASRGFATTILFAASQVTEAEGVVIPDAFDGPDSPYVPYMPHVPHVPHVPEVLVLSTESRDVDATSAARLNRDAVRRVREASRFLDGVETALPLRVYKKIDSALRGHPREELVAIMAELGVRRALVAPALPEESRTTLGGRQFIGGVPVELSLFGEQTTTSDLLAIFDGDAGGEGAEKVHALGLQTIRMGVDTVRQVLLDVTEGIVVADAETDTDLLTLASAAMSSDIRVLSGSAGLARQLAFVLPLVPGPPSRRSSLVEKGPVLIVAGSRHRATDVQIDALRRAGYPLVCLDQDHIDDPATAIHDTIDALASHLAAGRSVLLTTTGLDPSLHGPAFVVSRLAEVAVEAASRGHIGGLVLTGGDVAAGVFAGMGATSMHLGGEIRPAMPWGIVESSRLPPLLVATKAGSFGTEDALLACVDHLTALG